MLKLRISLALSALLLLLSPSAINAEPSRPNIIFILADDWGIGDVKTYGGDLCKIETPQMDKLAKDGMKFMDAHSSSSVCTPTRYGVLTGRYNWRSPLKQGVLYGYSPPLIEKGRETVPSFLKKNGYHTAMFGKWHLGMDFPTTDGKPAFSKARKPEQLATLCNVNWKGQIKNGPNSIGFDVFYGISASLDMHPYIWIDNDRFVGECTTIKAFHRSGPSHKDFEDYDVLPTLATKASEYVRQQSKSGKPFFMYMALNSPHTPISPSKKWKGKSGLGKYYDFVMETDDAIGQVINAVDESGIAKNTLIIVTADNGCSPAASRGDPKKMIKFRMGDKDPFDPKKHYASHIYRGHKADIYEGGHRVPYIARWTGKVKAGSKYNHPVCLIDLFATAREIVGGKAIDTQAEDSVSILSVLLGKTTNPVREAIVHHSINGSFSIRKGKWKLLLCPGSGGWSKPRPPRKNQKTSNKVQLYDLEADPAETKNLDSEHPKVVEELTKLLQTYVDKGRSTPGKAQENNGKVKIRR